MIIGPRKDTFEECDARRKVFWLLKRLTSYTLWQRKCRGWEAFVEAYEDAIKHWTPEEVAYLGVDLLPLAYDALARYKEGLESLARGYRFVWRAGQPLYEAHHMTGTVFANFYGHPDYWERGTQLQPFPEHIERLQKLMLAGRFHGDRSPLEISAHAAYRVAHWSSPRGLLDLTAYEQGFYSLPYPVFPSDLPDPPAGNDAMVVSTGDSIPVDGIWEPVTASKEQLLGLISTGNVQYAGWGCFNYFVEGVCAPRIGKFNDATKRVDQLETLWRLVWADDRYTDGIVGDESEYFLTPRPTAELAPAADPGEAMTNSICPASGWWEAVGYQRPAVHIAAGAVMPDISVRDAKGDMVLHYVRWKLVRRD
jgi:hypothetical protein